MRFRWPFVRRSLYDEAIAAGDDARARADAFERLAFRGGKSWRRVAETRRENLQRAAKLLSDYAKGPS